MGSSGVIECSNTAHFMNTMSCLNFARCVHLGKLHVQLKLHGVMVFSRGLLFCGTMLVIVK
jgi:hypothetical protein